MKKLLVIVLLTSAATLSAQEKGIHFEHSLSWQEVLAKAKAEHKYIFMDCFATWCGPCKYMSANIFPMEEVGSYFNQHYISVKVQLDTTAGDKDEVKKWYQSGHDLAAKYMIQAYPTYLFFDETGNAVHRSIGSSDATAFLAKAADAMNPDKQYYTLLQQYRNGKKDSAFLRNMALAARNAYDMENGATIINEYLATQTDLYTAYNLTFILDFINSSKDKGFEMMRAHPEKIDAIGGKGYAARQVGHIILREEVLKNLPEDSTGKPDWADIDATLIKKYPAEAAEVLLKGKIIWYQRNKDWNNYKLSVNEYIAKFAGRVSPEELNSYAWTVFQNCKDMTCVTEALDWSRHSFDKEQNPLFMDTYANILYKIGKKDEAIQWETKALSLADEGSKKDYMETIEKMKKGEKTWYE